MLSLFRRKAAASSGVRLPDGIRVYAIGDVHGRLDLLEALLEAIEADDAARGPARTHLIFLGDLIDRGPQSAQVLERVRSLAQSRADVVVLQGNHEEVFLLALEGDREALRFFTRIGGRETILSYGIDEETYRNADYEQLAALLERQVPAAHVRFLAGMGEAVGMGDYLFVHAGIRPGIALDQQDSRDLRWIRGEFLAHEGDNGCVVVHGHTPSEAVEWRSNRIGIDTAAWETGRLTALGLEGAEQWLLDTAGFDAALDAGDGATGAAPHNHNAAIA